MSEKYHNRYRVQSARAPWWNYGRDAAYFITICTRNRKHYFGEIIDGKMELSPVGVIAHLLWHEIKNHSKHCALGEFVVMPDHVHGVLILNSNDSKMNESPMNESPMNEPPINESRLNESPKIVSPMVETRHALSLPLGIQSDEPLGIQFDEPLVMQSDEPLVMQSDEPLGIQSDEPLVMQLDEPLVIQPGEPNSIDSNIEKLSPAASRFQNQGKNTISSIVGSFKSAVTKHAHRLGYKFAWQGRFHDHIIRDEKELERISDYIRRNIENWDEGIH